MKRAFGCVTWVLLWFVLWAATACGSPAAVSQAAPVAPAEPTPTLQVEPGVQATAAVQATDGAELSPGEWIKWSFPTEGAIWGTPALLDDTLYFGNDEGLLYAVDLATRKETWSFATGGAVRSRPDFAVVEERTLVYFTSDDGFLYALDAEAGTEVWRTDIGNEVDRAHRESGIGNSTSPTGYDYLQSSPVVSNGRVHIGSEDGQVYALNGVTGEVIWTFQTEGRVRATPTINAGKVYIGSWDKTMMALDAETGELLWQTPVGGQVQTTALVAGGVVYSASRKASVVALDAETGALLWEHSYGNNMWVESSPVLAGDMIFIGSSGSKVIYALDSKTGQLRLMHNTRAFCWSTPLVMGEVETLAIGCTNPGSYDQGLFLYSIGPNPQREGMMELAETWRVPMGESLKLSGQWMGVAGSPIEAGGVLYFGGLDGVLYAVGE
jgi:eukaryotic-like serine/threonine-protein kinase